MTRRASILRIGHLAFGGAVLAAARAVGVSRPPLEAHHAFTVTARRYSFSPARLEVHRGDVVKITLETEDIAHSFTIDALRVCKRVTPGSRVTFEFFVGDEPGTFPFYCSLTADEGCRRMRGELVVR